MQTLIPYLITSTSPTQKLKKKPEASLASSKSQRYNHLTPTSTTTSLIGLLFRAHHQPFPIRHTTKWQLRNTPQHQPIQISLRYSTFWITSPKHHFIGVQQVLGSWNWFEEPKQNVVYSFLDNVEHNIIGEGLNCESPVQ